MGNFQDELLNAGLVSKERLRREQIEEEVTVMNDKKLAEQLICTADLENCGTISAFKQTTKKILLADWTLIEKILPKAYDFQGQGSNELIVFFHRVRDGLMVVPSDKREQFLKRAFRRAGATFKIPEDWLR